MNALEKRDRLDRPAQKECGGECLIVMRTTDGRVHTLAGIAYEISVEQEMDTYMDNYWKPHNVLLGVNVTVHFGSDVTETVREMEADDE